jgi:hypothetical protein
MFARKLRQDSNACLVSVTSRKRAAPGDCDAAMKRLVLAFSVSETLRRVLMKPKDNEVRCLFLFSWAEDEQKPTYSGEVVSHQRTMNVRNLLYPCEKPTKCF